MKRFPDDVELSSDRSRAPRSCCCCLSTTATAIIAVLYAVGSVTVGGVCTVVLTVKSVREHVTKVAYEAVMQYVRAQQHEGYSESYSTRLQEMTCEEFGEVVSLWIKVYLGLAIFVFLFSLMVFYGIIARKPGYLMPLYVWIFVKVILSVVGFCFYPVDAYPMWVLIAATLVLVIKIYFLVCIWNAYKQLKFQGYEEQGYQQVYLPNYDQAMMSKEQLPPAYSP
ncbi:uncharacterized protein LOC134183802 [Corticium candelabrum]|uniref:uncharacterized protein LOC134183802 n=1 Tax=Corticium candelabrum TaxID=121492 RepID=UPI002E26190B|nr:uncharacterized protein LOC134183802 [Corticium candelabrum]